MFRLTKFGTTSIEYYNQVDGIGSGETPTAYQVLPEGGALDLFGSQQKHPGVVEYTKAVRLQADTQAALSTLFFGLLALRGKRDKLYRELIGGSEQWKYARLVEVNASRDYQQTRFRLIQDVELRFMAQDVFWRGEDTGLFFDTGLTFDSGWNFDTGTSQSITSNPTAFDIVIGTDAGRAPIRAMTITINPGASSMSNITIARTGGEIMTFTGTVASGSRLVIDTGTLQVTNGGADAYADITFQPSADLANWFTLEPGTNAITVSYTGGGTGRAIHFAYYEVWY